MGKGLEPYEQRVRYVLERSGVLPIYKVYLRIETRYGDAGTFTSKFAPGTSGTMLGWWRWGRVFAERKGAKELRKYARRYQAASDGVIRYTSFEEVVVQTGKHQL